MFTQYGLIQVAGALTNGEQSLYLVIESFSASLSSSLSPGATSVTTNQRVDQTGDIQIVLSPGLSTQEIVSFSAVSGSGPYTYTISPCSHAHASGDPVCRQVAVTDTMSNVVGEVQFDPVNAPGQRVVSPGGYSVGPGNWVFQFYLPGGTAQTQIMICGISDSQFIGQGNLLAHFILGLNNSGGTNDLEIDASLTIANA